MVAGQTPATARTKRPPTGARPRTPPLVPVDIAFPAPVRYFPLAAERVPGTMPHATDAVVRDPDTGQFRKASEVQYDDYEVVAFTIEVHADGHIGDSLSLEYGNRGEFEGLEVLDFDSILDRHRLATLIHVDLRGVLQFTQDGIVPAYALASVELSGSPSIRASGAVAVPDADRTAIEDVTGNFSDVTALVELDDTLDLPLRPLLMAANNGFEDTDATNGTGIGGAGAAGVDQAYGPLPGTWQFDRRDELYLNGVLAHQNSQAGDEFTVEVAGIAAFGVSEA